MEDRRIRIVFVVERSLRLERQADLLPSVVQAVVSRLGEQMQRKSPIQIAPVLLVERRFIQVFQQENIALMAAILTPDSGRADMVLDPNQMQRQMAYETALHWLRKLLEEGLVSRSEYDSEVSEIESKINPIIAHIPLLYKE